MTSNYRPLPGNKNGVMIHPTLEFGRSIGNATKAALLEAHFKNLPNGSVTRKDWYDPIWRSDWRGGGVQPRRAKLSAEEVDIEETADQKETTLRFPSPEPKFASQYNFANNHARWMNVVQFSDFNAGHSSFALTFPPNIRGEQFPALDFAAANLCTREGIVLFRRYKLRSASLRLLSQQNAVVEWLRSRSVKTKPSNSGRNAVQVLRSVGGVRGTSLFADEGTIKLLDKMAKTIQREEDGTTAQYADRTASIGEWKEVLGRRSKRLFFPEAG